MTPKEKRKLALRWAPIHYQAVSDSIPKADFITKINFAGTWNTRGNWNALNGDYRLTGAAYYSVVETEEICYILYVFYHARDWDQPFVGQHENDLEGFLAIVQRPVKNKYLMKHYPDGILLGLITCAHDNFYSYSNVLGDNREDVDRKIKFEQSDDGLCRPCTYQQPKSHGCYALKNKRTPYVRYIPTDKSGDEIQPPNKRPPKRASAYYELIDIHETDGFWQHRWTGGPNTPFTIEGMLRGSKHGGNKANPPWLWDDKNDGHDLPKGMLAYDPAYIAGVYYSGFIPGIDSQFFRYTDMPYVPFKGKIYGEAADRNRLNQYLVSANIYERLCAAGQLLYFENIPDSVARVIVDSLLDKNIVTEALSLVRNLIKKESRPARLILPMIISALKVTSLKDNPTGVIGLIRALQHLDADAGRSVFIKLYIESKDNYVKIAAANALADATKVADRKLEAAVYKNLDDSADKFLRSATGHLYLQWYLDEDPERLKRFIDADYIKLRLLAIDAYAITRPSDYKLKLANLLKKNPWEVRVKAAVSLVRCAGEKGWGIVRGQFGEELAICEELVKKGKYNFGGNFGPCPKSRDDYGRLLLITTLTELMRT